MKRIIIATLAFFTLGTMTRAQQPYTVNPFPRTITVTGSAEMEVVPDRIFVNITLKEYKNKNEKKKELDDIKTQFLAALKQAGIADSFVSIFSYGGENNYYHNRKKKRDTDLMASITYQVRFSSSTEMDRVIDRLDDEATESFNIISTTHSRAQEFRKQLKIEAVKASKEKAIYLAESVGAGVGVAVTITEPAEWQPMMYYAQSNMSVRMDESQAAVDFKKLKLRFEVTTVYELK